MYSVSRPKKKVLKVRCQVRRLWRHVAVASVDHPYIMYIYNVCFYINRRFVYNNEKIWPRLSCSYFFLAIIVLNCSCSINVSNCFSQRFCVFFL